MRFLIGMVLIGSSFKEVTFIWAWACGMMIGTRYVDMLVMATFINNSFWNMSINKVAFCENDLIVNHAVSFII